MESAQHRSNRARDDQLFTMLLGSAYSLQEHQDRIRSKVPAAKFREIMDEMISTLSLIRSRHLDSDTAMQLVVNRTQKLAAAAGAAIGLLDGENLEYKVGTGIGAALLGLTIRANSSISFERLGKEPLTSAWEDTALKARIAARIMSVPLYRGGRLAGCIQLFSRTGHFDDYGVPVCELMSAIVSHSMGNALPQSEGTFRKAVLAEWENGVHVENVLPQPANGNLASSQAKPRTFLDKVEGQRKKVVTLKAPHNANGSATDLGIEESLRERNLPHNKSEDVPNMNDLLRELQQTEIFRREMAQGPNSLSAHSNGHSGGLPLGAVKVHEVTQTAALDSQHSLASADVSEFGDYRDAPINGGINSNPDGAVPNHEVWVRLKRIFYPVLVLAFALAVRIKAGAQSWPLEIAIYILLVITTLELVQRFSEP